MGERECEREIKERSWNLIQKIINFGVATCTCKRMKMGIKYFITSCCAYFGIPENSIRKEEEESVGKRKRILSRVRAARGGKDSLARGRFGYDGVREGGA